MRSSTQAAWRAGYLATVARACCTHSDLSRKDFWLLAITRFFALAFPGPHCATHLRPRGVYRSQNDGLVGCLCPGWKPTVPGERQSRCGSSIRSCCSCPVRPVHTGMTQRVPGYPALHDGQDHRSSIRCGVRECANKFIRLGVHVIDPSTAPLRAKGRW